MNLCTFYGIDFELGFKKSTYAGAQWIGSRRIGVFSGNLCSEPGSVLPIIPSLCRMQETRMAVLLRAPRIVYRQVYAVLTITEIRLSA